MNAPVRSPAGTDDDDVVGAPGPDGTDADTVPAVRPAPGANGLLSPEADAPAPDMLRPVPID